MQVLIDYTTGYIPEGRTYGYWVQYDETFADAIRVRLWVGQTIDYGYSGNGIYLYLADNGTLIGTDEDQSSTHKGKAFANGAEAGDSQRFHEQTITIRVPLSYSGKTVQVKIDHEFSGGNILTRDLTLPNVLPSYSLTVARGTGVASVTVERTESSAGATGIIAEGTRIYDGDKLRVTATYASGYQAGTGTGDFTVSSSWHAVNVTAALKTYELSIRAADHTHISVKKGGVEVPAGTVSHGDVLDISATVDAGYSMKSATVTMGGTTKNLPAQITVSSDVTVTTVGEASGTASIGGEPYLIHIFDGTEFSQYQAHIYTSGAWVPYS